MQSKGLFDLPFEVCYEFTRGYGVFQMIKTQALVQHY